MLNLDLLGQTKYLANILTLAVAETTKLKAMSGHWVYRIK